MTQTISVEFLLCTRHNDDSVRSSGLDSGGDGDRDGAYVCVCGGEIQKENDLVPALKCGKCRNEDSVKGCGIKEAGDICSKRWGRGMEYSGRAQ